MELWVSLCTAGVGLEGLEGFPSNTNHSTILWCSPTLTHPPFSYPHAPALEARDVSCCMPVSSVGHRKHLGLWEYLYMWIAPIVFGMSREECHKRQGNPQLHQCPEPLQPDLGCLQGWGSSTAPSDRCQCLTIHYKNLLLYIPSKWSVLGRGNHVLTSPLGPDVLSAVGLL